MNAQLSNLLTISTADVSLVQLYSVKVSSKNDKILFPDAVMDIEGPSVPRTSQEALLRSWDRKQEPPAHSYHDNVQNF